MGPELSKKMISTTGFALALATLIVTISVSYPAVAELIDAEHSLHDTQQIRRSLENTLSRVKDAEIAQRSYLLTGERRYLEVCNGAMDTAAEEIRAQLMRDNPEDEASLNALKLLIAARSAEIRAVVHLRDEQGLAAALQLDQRLSGKKVVTRISQLAGKVEAAETQHLAERNQGLGFAIRKTASLFLGGTLLNFVVAVWAMRVVVRTEKAQRLLELGRVGGTTGLIDPTVS